MVDCVIFSTGRAASTSIYRYLDEMCNLSLPANKEPHYWLDGALDYRGIPEVLKDIYVANLDDYERLYRAARLRVDASVGYYHYAEKVVAKIQETGKTPKILMLVREPVAWALSLHTENLYQNVEQRRSLEECLTKDRTDPNLWWQLRYRDVRYREVYEVLRAVFPELLLIDYDEFRSDVDGVMRRICRFLDLDVLAPPSGEMHHSSRERMMQMRFPGVRRLGAWVPDVIRRPVGRLLIGFPPGKVATVRDEVLEDAMSESIASYKELWEFVRARHRMGEGCQ